MNSSTDKPVKYLHKWSFLKSGFQIHDISLNGWEYLVTGLMLTVWTEYPLDFSLEANSGFGKHQLIILPDSVKDIVFETIDESGEVAPWTITASLYSEYFNVGSIS